MMCCTNTRPWDQKEQTASNLGLQSNFSAASLILVALPEPNPRKSHRTIERCGLLQWRDNSVQHFVLTILSDQLLEMRHNLVPSRHHRLHFLLGEVLLGFFCERVRVQRLQLLQQLSVAAY
jgi:hypothetical protein